MSKLFVSNFPAGYSEENMELIFSPFGTLRSLKVVSEPRSFAIVEFEAPEQSEAAMQALRGRRLFGHQDELHIEPAFDRKRRVAVSNIPQSMSRDGITDFFKYYGPVENVTLSDRAAFVDFRQRSDVEKLLALDGKISCAGQKLSIKPFEKKEPRERTQSADRCVFVYNLPPNATKTDLADAFEKFGEIESSGVLSGGKAFVNYTRELSALKAIRHMDGKKIGSKKIRVTLKSMKKR